MKKNVLALSLIAGCLIFSSCASKKDLENCQLENKELTGKYQDTKDQLSEANMQLASSKARVTALEEQLRQARADYSSLQNSLDKSLTASNQTTVNISKLVDQINESNQYIRHLV